MNSAGDTSNHENAGAAQAERKRWMRQCLREAERLEDEGRLAEAANCLEAIVEAVPRSVTGLRRLAGIRRGQGRLEDAIDLARRAVELRKSDYWSQELLMQLYLEAGDYQNVIDSGKLLLKHSPRNPYLRDVMGVAYLQLGLLDKALQVTSELIHLDPLEPSHHFKRAVLFQQKGEIGKAIREFTRVVEMAPDAEIADEASDAIAWLDSFQIRQIIGLALEDQFFRTKLLRDPEEAVTERGFILSLTGMATLKHIDFEHLLDPSPDADNPTYH